MTSTPQQAAKLAASYDQYRRSRGDRTLADTHVRLTFEERMMVSRHVWSDSPRKTSRLDRETALSDVVEGGLRIECVPTEPRDTLADRMEISRKRQAADDRQLASTFCHDGSMSLVFKRRAS